MVECNAILCRNSMESIILGSDQMPLHRNAMWLKKHSHSRGLIALLGQGFPPIRTRIFPNIS